jgi:hypothetical protein
MIEFLALLIFGFTVSQLDALPDSAKAKVDKAEMKVSAQYDKAETWLNENTSPIDYSKMND